MAEKSSITFITDENMGPCISKVFKAIGINYVMHLQKDLHHTPDPDIIKHIGIRNAIFITCDRNMLNSKEIMDSVRQFSARILFLSSKYAQSSPLDKTAWFLKHWKKIESSFDNTDELLLTIEWNGKINTASEIKQRKPKQTVTREKNIKNRDIHNLKLDL